MKPVYRKAVQVGTLLRPEIHQLRPEQGRHVLAYLRQLASTRALDALAECDQEVRVYGLGRREPDRNLRFFEIDEKRFLEDLASSDCYIGAAGNQTLGECLYLGKPVFAVPEAAHHEQLINSHFLRLAGAGDFVTLETVSASDIKGFWEIRDSFRGKTDPQKLNGTPHAVAALERFL